MPARRIYEHDIPELRKVYGELPARNTSNSLIPILDTHHPEMGAFRVSNLAFSGMFLLDMHWSVPDDLIVYESNASETVDINFVMEGNVLGNFRQLAPEFSMCTGTHNLKYTPSEKSTHRATKQDARLFVISIEKDYFRELIGHDNAWADMVQEKMEREESFLASKKFMPQTPQMQALIQSIRNVQPSPMSRLLAQSMTFELLARQIDQLRCIDSHHKTVDNISADDRQKLHFVRDYIERNFLEELTLTSLCRKAALNEFKLKKGFKALFNTSVIEYSRSLRMQYAQTLLRDHRQNIEEVSTRLGYQYPNHFSVAYKKYFGTVPSVR